MTRREAAKGVPGPIFSPRGFVGLVLFPPVSRRLSPHPPLTSFVFSVAGPLPPDFPTLISPLNSSPIPRQLSSDV